MRESAILLLCAVALAQGINEQSRACNCDPSEAQQICRSNYDNDEILIAHENCNQFYKCANGNPVAYFCPNNLLYDPYSQVCQWPDNVECGDRPIAESPVQEEDSGSDDVTPGNNCDPSEAPTICAADNSDGVLVAHENCNQFYQCSGSKPVALTCPPGLLYNPANEICDWSENVDCGDRVIPEPEEDDSTDVIDTTENDVTCNCDPEEAPAICAALGSENELIAHENCNQYYICNHGLPIAVSCFGDLLFNPYTRQCDWPRNVDCGDRLVPETECTGCNDNTNDASCDEDDVVPPPGDTEVVPPGTGNEPEDSDNVVVPTRPPGTCKCNPEEAPSICAAEDSDGVLVAHENCNQFYKCDHGKPVVQSCYGNLLYNPYTEQCDWPENVDCGDRVIQDPDDIISTPGGTNPGVTNPADTTPGNNCNPSEAPTICAADDSDGVLVAHENCNQFYKCSEGKPVALKCPPGLLYNPAKDQCDWPENVDCGDRVIPDPESSEIAPPGDDVVVPTRPPGTCNCNPGEAPSICAAEDSDGVLVAHENCNQFYKCDHGKPAVLTCYGELLYNPYTEQCDWPENVDCGDRVIPDPDNSVSTPGVTNPGVTNPGVTNPGVTNPGVTNPGVTNPPGNNCDPSEAPSICAADNSEGILVAHENCNQFYKCSEGKPAVYTCPPNLLYNPNKDQCDWPFNVDCGDRLIPNPEGSDSDEIPPPGDDIPPQPPVDSNEDCSGNNDENAPCNCDPDQAPSICAGVNTDGILIAHENCNQFYQCVNNRPVPIRCPANTLYNPVSQTCDWPFNVDCGDRIIPDLDDNVTESKENDSEEEEIVGPCNCNPAEAPAICAATGSSGVQIAHENCNQFYICDHYRPVVFTCNGLLLYNPYTQRCEWPETVECGDRVIPEPGSESDENDSNEENVIIPNDDPSQAPTICAGEGSEGVLVAHENCDQYYICSGGVPVSRPCNDGLFYNPNNQRCDWPSNVVCGDRIVPDDCACNPRNAPALCAKPGSDGKLIAHENCNQFYICAHSVPVPQSCPASLLYNPDKELCDWPRSVNCEARLLLFASLNKHSQTRQSLRN